MVLQPKATFQTKCELPIPPVKRFPWIVDEKKYLHIEELRRLTTSASEEQKTGINQDRFSLVRDWFTIELGLNAGLRVEEMTEFVHNSLMLDYDRSSLWIIGKGDKPRPVWISSAFKRTILSYLAIKKKFGFGDSGYDVILPSRWGRQISRRYLQKVFKRIAGYARLPERYSIHSLRHTYATYLLHASNYNFRFVQKQLGHASIKTTQAYAGVLPAAAKQALETMYE